MEVYLNEISGIGDAIVSMFISKRSWTRSKELEIRDLCAEILDRKGMVKADADPAKVAQLNDWLNTLVKWGWTHITMLRFIDLSITVEGLHRAGQDDWDAHAARFNNRIIRSSTRLATFGYELSEWYADKIIPTDLAMNDLGVTLPDSIEKNGLTYVKTINGYIREDLREDMDVKRGLYMLSIPSNFLFKVNMTEWAHVYKERNAHGRANPEVKICCEKIADKIEGCYKQFNRELFDKIKN